MINIQKIMDRKIQKIITKILICLIIVLFIMIGFFININKTSEQLYNHYHYNDITLIITPDWHASNVTETNITFKKDVSNIQSSPAFIDDFTVQRYNDTPYTSLKLLVNSFIYDMESKKYHILSFNTFENNETIKSTLWIKCFKENEIIEIFFFKKNNIFYSISTHYNWTQDKIDNEPIYELHNIVKELY